MSKEEDEPVEKLEGESLEEFFNTHTPSMGAILDKESMDNFIRLFMKDDEKKR